MSTITELLAEHDHEELTAFRDDGAGLRGFVAIHDTTLGPAAGGTRRYAFESETDAIIDALRLSRAMTYKYALAGINMGGAKAVIWVDDDDRRSEALYRAYGRVVETFGGRFVTGGDVGTGEREVRWIDMETDYVVGLPEQFDHPDGYHPGGLGVIRAMEACATLVYGDDRELGDLHVTVQGVGDMGASIVRYLSERGARITVADIDPDRVSTMESAYDVDSVDPDAVYDVDCDVFAPSALGFVLNDETIPRLDCDIVCGAANNQLDDEDRHGRMLHDAGVLYAPDFLANAGQTIDDTDLLRKGGYTYDRARTMIDAIYDRMLEVGRRSERDDRPTDRIATEMAHERLDRFAAIRPSVRETKKPRW